MATTGILWKGKIYAFDDEYPAELEQSLEAQGKNHFGQKVTLSTEEAERLKGKSDQTAADSGKGAKGK